VKERLFREAETAGRLNHPYIVTIFDAGEEHDLAYIAMEFLKGKDLVPYTKYDNLLPIERVTSIHARVAEALAYAHRQNVVHRDIKPANMMYEPESDTVKVTDFGIARITDSSRTKTGMVLGTPSYMSPEQLSGQKIDGRSDLFSLAVSLYQMCSGHLPFVGDSMAVLMFKIANEEAADVRTHNPAVPEALALAIAKGMRKDITQRYQTGDEMAADLRAVFGAPGATSPGQTAVNTAPQIVARAPVAPPPPAPTVRPAADAMQATVVNRPSMPPIIDPMAATLVTRAPAPPAPPPAPVAAPAPAPAATRAPDPNIKTVVDPYDPFTKTDVLPSPEEGKKEGSGDVDFEF
jgi:serine/threonine-protein kinase